MSDVIPMPTPLHHRTPSDALATAARQNFESVIIIGGNQTGMMILHNDQTAAELVWGLEKAKLMVLGSANIQLCDPQEIG